MHQKTALDGKDILILGDDDLVSLACFMVGKPKSVTVVEVDKEIANAIKETATEHSLPIIVVSSDLRYLRDLKGSFQSVAFDPPYTAPGVTLFLKKALENLSCGEDAKIFMCFGAGPKNDEKFLKVQEIISGFDLVIEEKLDGFNRYHGASGVKNTSSLYILRSTDKTDTYNVSQGEKNIYTFQVPPKLRLPHIEHYAMMFFGVDRNLTTAKRELENTVTKSCEHLKIKWVAKSHKNFKGGGMTLNFVLEQSNLSVHTWPELSMIHLDLLIFSPLFGRELIAETFAKNFKTETFEFRRLE